MRSEAEMQASRRLDERIAREVFNLPDNCISLKGPKPVFRTDGRPFGSVAELDHFSERIEAAWQVVTQMTATWTYDFSLDYDAGLRHWVARFDSYHDSRARADTPALAICLSALKALKASE